MGSRVVSWSDLPQEMVTEIAKRLESPSEVRNFRVVCKFWSTFCPLPSNLISLHFPKRISPPQNDPFVWSSQSLILVASNIYVLHPRQGEALENLSKPWIVRLEEVHPGVLQVQRPLTHNWNLELPKDFPANLNLSCVRVTEVFNGFNLRREPVGQHQNELLGLDVNKVVLYSKYRNTPATVNDFTAVVLFLVGRLYTVRLSDSHWESVKFGRVSRFDDVLNFRGKICVIDRKGRLYVFCVVTLSYACIVTQPVPSHPLAETRKHLVELNGELYLVHFVGHFFRVYRWNVGGRLWTDVNSFGEDRLLFVGPDCCFFVLTRDFPGWIGNIIVYHIDSFRTYRRDGHASYSRHDNPNKNIFFSVYHMGDYLCKNIYSLMGYTDVLWPPPAWLRYPDPSPVANTSGERLAEADPETNVPMVDDQDARVPT